MTFPMSISEKSSKKKEVLESLINIKALISIAIYYLKLTVEDDFSSERVENAKALVMEVNELSLYADHNLHEIIDAPLMPL